VLDAGRTWFSAAGRVRTVPRALLVTAAVALEGIGHSDQRVYDFRCPWRDLARRCRDTEKTRGPGRARIHIHIQIVHACVSLSPFVSPGNIESSNLSSAILLDFSLLRCSFIGKVDREGKRRS